MSRNPILLAIISGILFIGVFGACRTAPKTENVWTLLAKGDLESARPFFSSEVSANQRDSQGRAPLHIAAEIKDTGMASFFIALGADVNALDRQNRTPLDISAELLDAPTAKALADAGADIHHPMQKDQSPARIAIRNNEFLRAIINPNTLEAVDSEGRTLLHIAAELGSVTAIDTILAAGGVNLTAKDNQGNTALDIALDTTKSRNHAQAAEHLILAGAISDNPIYTYFAPAVRSANYNLRSNDGMTPLHYMAREGYMGYIIYALERGGSTEIKNASGATPLHEAVRSGNTGVINQLLDAGADINAQDAKGNSVLHIAVPPQYHQEVAQLLFLRGAQPNSKDEHGDTPVHVLVTLNRPPELLRLFQNNGAEVNVRNINGKTPLYLAVENERTSLIPLLLSWNSDIFAADNDGLTPFENALIDHPSVISLLVNRDTVQQSDSLGNTMLHIAIRAKGDSSVIGYLVDNNISVNARNKEGDTALHIAVRVNDESSGTLLLGRGADIFASNARGESPLFLAFPANSRNTNDFRRWMFNNATLKARDGLGNTVLHYVASWQYDNYVQQLVQMGADLEAVNGTGEPPVFMAVKNDSPSTVNTFIGLGARIDSRDSLGNTALHAAVQWNAPRAAEMLINLGMEIDVHNLNGKTPLHASIRSGMVNIETLLLRNGADIEARDNQGNTPFVEAVMMGDTAAMQRLVNLGADFDTRNFSGDTPLHISAAFQLTDATDLLLQMGASIHARNSAGRTPFQNALAASSDMVRSILTRDRINTTDDFGSSPLHIAIQERASLEIINTILRMGGRVSALDSEGRTPLRLAIDSSQWDVAKVLADSGSDIFLSARDGKTPAEVTLSRGSTAIQAVFSGRAILGRDTAGNTILHYAAQTGNTAVINQLIGLGADKTVLNIASESPADIALRWRNTQAASLLR